MALSAQACILVSLDKTFRGNACLWEGLALLRAAIFYIDGSIENKWSVILFIRIVNSTPEAIVD